MSRLANVLIASSDFDFQERFVNNLAERGFSALACDDDDELQREALKSEPDIILIDVSAEDFDGFASAQALKNSEDTRQIPIVLIAKNETAKVFEQALECNADDIVFEPLNFDVLYFHLRPLLRLSTMFRELVRRVDLASEFDVDASAEIADQKTGNYRVIVVAPATGEASHIESALGVGSDLTICENVFEAEDKLTEPNTFYDAVVINADAGVEAALSFASHLRNNPRLFNLPIILTGENQVFDDVIEAYRRGITRILLRPLSHEALKATLRILVQGQRLRWAIQKAIATTCSTATIDPLTGTYSYDFFKAHLKNLIEVTEKWNKHLSVIFFSVPNAANVADQFGEDAERNLVQQVSQWITGLTRGEDLVTRNGRNEFGVILPDTPPQEAQSVMQRIAGILGYTDFAIPDVFQPVTVWVEVGLASLEAGDTVDTIIERARGPFG